MGRKSFNIPGHSHFLTFSCWKRRPFLTDRHTCSEFTKALNKARRIEQFDIWAYVLMPEHVHLLIRPRRDVYAMAGILRRIKEAFARDVLRDWRRHHPERLPECADTGCHPVKYRFWQPGGGFVRNLWSHNIIRNAVTYIEANPIRRGLVGDSLDWEWSSARSRAGQTDVLLVVDPIAWEFTPIPNDPLTPGPRSRHTGVLHSSGAPGRGDAMTRQGHLAHRVGSHIRGTRHTGSGSLDRETRHNLKYDPDVCARTLVMANVITEDLGRFATSECRCDLIGVRADSE